MYRLQLVFASLAFAISLFSMCGCKEATSDLGLQSVLIDQQKENQRTTKEDQEQDDTKTKVKEKSNETNDKQKKENSVSLFDGKTLDGWESIEFGGEGDITVADGEIQMLPGDPLTGICVLGDTDLPTENYEISLKGVKRDGHDFFCGITFPVKDNFCTLIVGGWGGGLVGLSNLDGRDASENGTKVTRKFEKNRWYAIRVKVLPERIVVWIDDEKLIDESTVGREVSIRNDVISTTPLGITNFQTESAFKDITIRTLD